MGVWVSGCVGEWVCGCVLRRCESSHLSKRTRMESGVDSTHSSCVDRKHMNVTPVKHENANLQSRDDVAADGDKECEELEMSSRW